MLIDGLAEGGGREALRFGERSLAYEELRGVAAWVAAEVGGRRRVAVWAVPELETCAAVVGVLAAGAAVVPVNPKAGERELAHIVSDSAPGLVLAAPGGGPPPGAAAPERGGVGPARRGGGPA